MLNSSLRRHLHERSASAVRTLADRRMLLHAAEVIGQCDEVPREIAPERMRELLGVIVPLLTCKGQIVRGYGASWLWQLAAQHRPAAECLLQSFGSPHARARLILVQYIGFSPNAGEFKTPLEKEVLRRGLRDRSAVVRRFSSDRVSGRIFIDLLPDIEEVLRAEGDAKTRKSFERCRAELVDGYHVHGTSVIRGEEFVSCWFRIKGASCGLSIPRRLVDEVGLKELVRRARSRKHDRRIPGFQFEPLPPGYEDTGNWPDSVLNQSPHLYASA